MLVDCLWIGFIDYWDPFSTKCLRCCLKSINWNVTEFPASPLVCGPPANGQINDESTSPPPPICHCYTIQSYIWIKYFQPVLYSSSKIHHSIASKYIPPTMIIRHSFTYYSLCLPWRGEVLLKNASEVVNISLKRVLVCICNYIRICVSLHVE